MTKAAIYVKQFHRHFFLCHHKRSYQMYFQIRLIYKYVSLTSWRKEKLKKKNTKNSWTNQLLHFCTKKIRISQIHFTGCQQKVQIHTEREIERDKDETYLMMQPLLWPLWHHPHFMSVNRKLSALLMHFYDACPIYLKLVRRIGLAPCNFFHLIAAYWFISSRKKTRNEEINKQTNEIICKWYVCMWANALTLLRQMFSFRRNSLRNDLVHASNMW